MKIKTIHVRVRRDQMTRIDTVIYAWIVPILEAVHGDDHVTVIGKGSHEVAKLPDAGEEFSRLCSVYGFEQKTEHPWAEVVYGKGKKGIRKLSKAMRKAIKAEKVKPGPVAKIIAKKIVVKKVTRKTAAKKLIGPTDPLGTPA